MWSQKIGQQLLKELSNVDFDLTGVKDKKSKIVIQRLNLLSKLVIRTIKSGDLEEPKRREKDESNKEVLKKLDIISNQITDLISRVDSIESSGNNSKNEKIKADSKFIPSISSEGMTIKTSESKKVKISKKNISKISKKLKSVK